METYLGERVMVVGECRTGLDHTSYKNNELRLLEDTVYY